LPLFRVSVVGLPNPELNAFTEADITVGEEKSEPDDEECWLECFWCVLKNELLLPLPFEWPPFWLLLALAGEAGPGWINCESAPGDENPFIEVCLPREVLI
jgi:hypothetical protein